MRTVVLTLTRVGLLGVGYLLGTTSSGRNLAWAQDAAPAAPAAGATDLSDDAKAKIKAASEALKSAMEALQAEGKYTTATKGMNAFLILSGGGNSVQDLSSEQGVDPETFAALHAGLVNDDMLDKITKDKQGYVLFNNRRVRIQKISALQRLYATRAILTEEEGLPRGDAPAAPAAPAEGAAPAAETNN